METRRATSFIVVNGRNGHRRIPLATESDSQKKTDASVVWVPTAPFMAAVNAVGLPIQVTLAGTPCQFQPRGERMRVKVKKQALHGRQYGPNGRQKANLSHVKYY